VNDSIDVEPLSRPSSVSPAASVPDALVTVEDLPMPDGEGGGVDDLPSARAPPFGTGSPDSSGPEAAPKGGIGASNPLGGPYWAKSREPLVTRVSSNKPIRTLAALSFSSMNLAMNPNILLIGSKMWRPQNQALLSTGS
jgi:hypothetical protein